MPGAWLQIREMQALFADDTTILRQVIIATCRRWHKGLLFGAVTSPKKTSNIDIDNNICRRFQDIIAPLVPLIPPPVCGNPPPTLTSARAALLRWRFTPADSSLLRATTRCLEPRRHSSVGNPLRHLHLAGPTPRLPLGWSRGKISLPKNPGAVDF